MRSSFLCVAAAAAALAGVEAGCPYAAGDIYSANLHTFPLEPDQMCSQGQAKLQLVATISRPATVQCLASELTTM